ncbi:hypothetical protein CQW23_30495 [Capsicum baccatum]|uniref:F-box domain-containing protein n=1 Tax=Capsicum baccatum TaxID=33114 RepID=A0A2G2VAA9_CAPBA|nr:hypothetical protein CQW23_30495 [Capsicum baccatum]
MLMEIVDQLNQAMPVHFQEDILANILCRLPVRSLLRFKCVSKLWKTLIDEPHFRMTHLNHAKNDENSQNFLFYQLRPMEAIFSIYCCPLSPAILAEDVRELDFPLIVEPRFCQVYCCCDGLVIITVYDNLAECHRLLLWNPSTRESMVLPTPKLSLNGICCLGISFDSNTGDYKILRILEDRNQGRKARGEILALKSGSWRTIDEHPDVFQYILFGMHSLAYIQGAFHWVGFSRNYFVVSFNISHEVYGEIPLPEQISMSYIDIGVSELEGMLCAYSNVHHQGENTFKLWMMKDYGVQESWNALFCITDPNIDIPVPKYVFANGEVLFWCIYYGRAENSYWTQNGPFTLLPRGLRQNGFVFIESFFSPRLLT